MKRISLPLTLRECIGYLYGKDINEESITLNELQFNYSGSILAEIETPDPTVLTIANRYAVIRSLLLGESIKLLLEDDIETTEEKFDELVENGDVVAASSNEEAIVVDGLVVSVKK